MADILSEIKARAKAKNKNIVLTEGEDARVVSAAATVVKEGFARITLLGNKEEIEKNNKIMFYVQGINKANVYLFVTLLTCSGHSPHCLALTTMTC